MVCTAERLCGRRYGRAGGGSARLIAVVALVASFGCGSPPVPPEERSIVFVTLDTTRADRIGAYGGSVPTPNIDRFAREGVVFEEGISAVPLTLPAHASMFTGRYPIDHGVRHNGIYQVPEDARTLAEVLGEEGFDTAGFVAAYVLNRGYGLEQGFETYDDVPVDRFAGGEDQLFSAERTAEEVNDAVYRWLDERDDDGRFFLWVHYYDPHDPYEPPESPERTLYGEGYDREVSYMDAVFGELVDRLERDGWLERSIVVLVADHGESLGEHGERTHGIFIYEGAVHIPMILWAPGVLPEGARVEGPAELVDLAPTLLEILGLEPLPDAVGESLVARSSGEADGRSEVAYSESLMASLEFGAAELYGVRTSRFKYIEAPRPELYDLRDDPAESLNLAPNDPERAAEMAALLQNWRAAYEARDEAAGSAREMSPEELARLQSLGYMQGGAADAGRDGTLDPKDVIREIRKLDAARDALAEGRAREALTAVEALLARNPSNHNARVTRIQALFELERYDDAIEEARAGLSLADSSAAGFAALANRLRGLLAGGLRFAGRLEEAEATYREVLEVDPDEESVAVDLARMLAADMGRPDEALELANSVIERNPRNGMAWAARFAAETELGLEEARVETAREIARDASADPGTLIEVGQLLLDRGDPEGAARAFEAAQNLLDLDPALLARLGLARFEAGDLDGAAEVLAAVARMQPRSSRAFLLLGRIALAKGDETRARGFLDQATRLRPSSADAEHALAVWLVEQGRIEEAVPLLESAKRRDPTHRGVAQLMERIEAGSRGLAGDVND